MNPPSHNCREARRLQAWRLRQQGRSQRRSAEALGVSDGAVSQWITRARSGGVDALRHRPPPGAPGRLTATQRAPLPSLLQKGPEAYGFRGEVWTRGRRAAVMRLTSGVASHPTHIGRVWKATRWGPQKPVRRARQRDEAASAHGRDNTWPAIQTGRQRSSTRSCA